MDANYLSKARFMFIPSQVDMSKIRSVVIGCVAFSQLMTSANLNK